MQIKEAQDLVTQVKGWQLSRDARLISKEFTFKNFKEAMVFANKVGDIAEVQGHHPDMYVGWGKVEVELWTHKIGGLSVNDFILAAKIEEIKR